jgi:16S rRNA (guanine527-N7)-methyltransferase
MVTEDILSKYFPELSKEQLSQFKKMEELYADWNQKINVISRKDIDQFAIRHVLHSLAIAKLDVIKPGESVMDLGTGGGFPGVPLALYYPDTKFVLVDSIRKKTKVIEEVVAGLGLTNVEVVNARAEDVKQKFEYVVSRAVAPLRSLNFWCKRRIKKSKPDYGMICLKGGDLWEEIAEFESENQGYQVDEYKISEMFEEDFFETKKIVRVLNY